MSVAVQRWVKTDLAQIAEIERACFSDCWSEKMLQEEYARTGVVGLVVKDGDETLGYACAASLFEDADLYRIAIRPAFRRTGLGSLLMNALFEELKAQGAERIFLEVRASNTPAVTMYEKYGFQTVRIRENYYAGKETAIEMQRDL